jgi:hypothetical protein
VTYLNKYGYLYYLKRLNWFLILPIAQYVWSFSSSLRPQTYKEKNQRNPACISADNQLSAETYKEKNQPRHTRKPISADVQGNQSAQPYPYESAGRNRKSSLPSRCRLFSLLRCHLFSDAFRTATTSPPSGLPSLLRRLPSWQTLVANTDAPRSAASPTPEVCRLADAP